MEVYDKHKKDDSLESISINVNPKDEIIEEVKSTSSIEWSKYIPKIVLAASIIENTVAMLQVRYSKASSIQYIPSVACIFVEFWKTLMSLALVYYQEGKIDLVKAFPWIYPGGFINFVKLSVPSILYTVSANLVHFGMSRLHVPLFQVLYQFRIIATVIISVFLFSERKYSLTKWTSCFFLFVGIVIANLDGFFSADETKTGESTTKVSEFNTSYIIAALAVLFAGISTAFAGVYSEKLLKVCICIKLCAYFIHT